MDTKALEWLSLPFPIETAYKPKVSYMTDRLHVERPVHDQELYYDGE